MTEPVRIAPGEPGYRVFEVERQVAPRVLPAAWRRWSDNEAGRWFRRDDGLLVCLSVNRWSDDRNWLHLSFSRADRLPSWEDVRAIKSLFVGPEKPAYQILPRDSEYVNLHPFCLHLWHCLDGDPLPSFAVGGQV